MTVAQYVNLDWFVTKEDHERAVEYAKRHGLTKPCDLMHHLIDLALGNEATEQGPSVSTQVSTDNYHRKTIHGISVFAGPGCKECRQRGYYMGGGGGPLSCPYCGPGAADPPPRPRASH